MEGRVHHLPLANPTEIKKHGRPRGSTLKSKASKKRKMDLSMAKEVFLSSVIAPGLVPMC